MRRLFGGEMYAAMKGSDFALNPALLEPSYTKQNIINAQVDTEGITELAIPCTACVEIMYPHQVQREWVLLQ